MAGRCQAAEPAARGPGLQFDRPHRDWSERTQRDFLVEAFRKAFLLFGFELLSTAEAEGLLVANDPERGRDSLSA